MSNIEQRYAIKFCVKLGKTATETREMLVTAYSNEALRRTQVFEWDRRFNEGQDSVEDDERQGRTKTATN